MVQCQPPLDLEELPKEDEERLEKVFAKLDSDGNGRIDIHDLSVALKELAPHINRSYAEKFLAKSGGKGGDISLCEFIHYVWEHEKNLRLQFSHIDKNQDGKVDLEELISAFADLGIAISSSEATNLLKRMDQDGSLNISYDEWRDYLMLAPATDIHALIHFWRHSTEKRDNRNQTGSAGGKRWQYDETDEMILSIIGKNTPVLEGLAVPESSGTQAAETIQAQDTSRPIPQSSQNNTNSANSQYKSVIRLKKEKLEAEILLLKEKTDLYKREKYKLDLELVKLEKELNITHSSYTAPYHEQNSVQLNIVQLVDIEEENVQLTRSNTT